jgi:hypothetical protein
MNIGVPARGKVSRRRAVRRAVSLDCEIISDQWDEPASFHATDLSHLGLWVNTQLPLEVGEEVIVSLTPPRWPRKTQLVALAMVARVGLYRRQCDFRESGMGMSFVDLETGEVPMLRDALRGMPPPLPRPVPVRPEVVVPETIEPGRPSSDYDPSLTLANGISIRFRAEGALLTSVPQRSVSPLRLVCSNGRMANAIRLRPRPLLRLAA